MSEVKGTFSGFNHLGHYHVALLNPIINYQYIGERTQSEQWIYG